MSAPPRLLFCIVPRWLPPQPAAAARACCRWRHGIHQPDLHAAGPEGGAANHDAKELARLGFAPMPVSARLLKKAQRAGGVTAEMLEEQAESNRRKRERGPCPAWAGQGGARWAA